MCKYRWHIYSCNHIVRHRISYCLDHGYSQKGYGPCRGWDDPLEILFQTKCGPCLREDWFDFWNQVHNDHTKTLEDLDAEANTIAAMKDDPRLAKGTTQFKLLGFNAPEFKCNLCELWKVEGEFWTKEKKRGYATGSYDFEPGKPSPLRNEVTPEDLPEPEPVKEFEEFNGFRPVAEDEDWDLKLAKEAHRAARRAMM
ncbi:hypothetical protein P152DRAFT_473679 [Eremomyces bilateralis CBS 781.70]|uniref:Uncharacterized protein n=1 Tax=Eremomyces bilateralis CBS 781.70 TaxID=1392243 RepID=A0A6G1G379_9PEZI|nr:uncharacterized protein P152DRAFT_473679 [Eremomyces bilateralis CBS 781.70]KAF1812514.1 hypothetical protein P152DRAFT_473679 [Eremomyces bilateralis CBS 781.70]